MTPLLALLVAANADRLADPDARVTVLLLDPFDLEQARDRGFVDLDDVHDQVPVGAAVVDLISDLDVHRVRGLSEVVTVDGVQPVPEHAPEPTS